MNPAKTIIKFEQVCDQTHGAIRRIVGFVKAKYLIDLIDAADLSANPRSAKVGAVTDDIIESIRETSDIFPFKTKGLLLAVTNFRELERKRFELEFRNSEIEGVLDGGHNMLAIALHILNLASEGDKSVRRIKKWIELKEVWTQFQDKIADIREHLEFLVPVEILVPADESEQTFQIFNQSILDICTARNNNVQLTAETKANKKGFYDCIRECLDPDIAKLVEWKTNDGGTIKVRDIVALSWIPLSVIELPGGIGVAPSQLYSSKGKCVEVFNELMSSPEISQSAGSDYTYELHNPLVESAFALLEDMPKLYDLIYQRFPDAYNSNEGKFGRIGSVRIFDPGKYSENPQKYLKKQPLSPFYGNAVTYQYPDGFIMPLVYALSALIHEVNDRLEWKVDPYEFISENLSGVVQHYKGVLELSQWDPQKVGKSSVSYGMAKQQFENCLLRQDARVA